MHAQAEWTRQTRDRLQVVITTAAGHRRPRTPQAAMRLGQRCAGRGENWHGLNQAGSRAGFSCHPRLKRRDLTASRSNTSVTMSD